MNNPRTSPIHEQECAPQKQDGYSIERLLARILPDITLADSLRIREIYNETNSGLQERDIAFAINVFFGFTATLEQQEKRETTEQKWARLRNSGLTHNEAARFAKAYYTSETANPIRDMQNAFAETFGIAVPRHPNAKSARGLDVLAAVPADNDAAIVAL